MEIHQLTDELDILNITVEKTRNILNCDRTIIYQLLPQKDGVIIAESVEKKWVSILGKLVYDPCFSENLIESYCRGRFSIIENIYSSGLESCHVELLQAFQIKANVVVPILIGKQTEVKLWGLLIAHQCDAPRQWHSLEVKLLQNIASQLGIVLQNLQKYKIKKESIYKEHKQKLKTELQASERRWQYALEGNTDGLWDWNIETNEVFFSPRWKEMLGFRDDEINNNLSEWKTRIHCEDKEKVYLNLNKHLRGETDYYISEHRIKCKDGSYKWILDRGQVFSKSEDGKPLRMIGTHTDITERKQIEKVLRDSEERYHSVIEAMTEGIVLQQGDGLIIACNKNAEKILGLTEDQMKGLTSFDPRWRSLHEDGSPFAGEDHPAMVTLSTGKPQTNVIMVVHKPDNQLTWISINSQPLFNPEYSKPYAVVTSFTDITERRQLEIDLQENEALFRGIFEQATVGAGLVDSSGKFLKVNERFCELLGYSEAELKQINYVDITHPDDRELNRKYNIQFWQKGISYSMEKRYLRKDGQIQWVNLTASPIYNFRGELQFALGIVLDISERKQAEIMIRQQVQREKLLNLITQNIRQSLDLDQILQTTVDEVRNFLETDRVIIYRLNPDWSGVVITESVSEESLSILGMEITDAYFVETKGGNYHNGKINNISDIYKVGFSDCHIKLLERLRVKAKLVVPILQDSYTWGLLIAHQCNSTREWQLFEVELLNQLATQVAIAIQQGYLFSQIQKELMERKIVEQKLKETNINLSISNSKLEDATKAKSEFLANMSHEIRTPMNGVIGMAQLLSMSNLSEEQKDLVMTIRDSGNALLTIINDILDFSKIESGKLELESNPYVLKDVLKSVCNLLTKQVEDKGINLNYSIDNHAPHTILGDSSRLRQIILNLVGNAIKFTQKGGVSINVISNKQTILENKQDAYFAGDQYELIFIIKDTGIGINKEQLNQLFQPFTQADASISRKYCGTGLGLAISKNLVTLMGGKIWIESFGNIGGNPPQNWLKENEHITKKNQGTTFYFNLPVTAVLTTEIKPEITPDQNQLKVKSSPSLLKILLAEDNLVNQKVALLTLKKIGYSADLANNGLEVLEMIKKQDYDVILMDLQMPEMDGLTATKIIRQSEEKQPYIIALTANVLEKDRQICLDIGMNDYIRKPLAIAELMKVLNKYNS